jgi:hypothetical protein
MMDLLARKVLKVYRVMMEPLARKVLKVYRALMEPLVLRDRLV